MPCRLTPGPFPVHFVTQTNVDITVFADSISTTVHIVAATHNGNPIPVDANGRAKFTTVHGQNLLNMAFAGSDPDEVFQIKEDCGGSFHVLGPWRLQQSPTGQPGGLTKEYRINAT